MNDAIDYLLDKADELDLELEVLGFARASTAISYAGRKLDQFSLSETRQLGVRLIDGKHEGVAYTESLTPESLDAVLEEARDNARMISREWISDLHAPQSLPELPGTYDSSLDEVPMERKLEAAAALESAALDFDSRITNVAYARYGDSRAQSWIANTRGLRATYKVNGCYAYARCLAKDGEQNVMAGDFEARRGFGGLDARRVAETAARKTLERIGAKRPDTGKYTIVFENRVAESLVGLIAGYFSGKAVDERTSPLAGKFGETIFSPEFTLIDDPLYIDGSACRPFDDEGYASKVTTLVERGRVQAFLTNSVLARKLGLMHTASASRAPSSDLDVAPSNLRVAPGTQSLEALLNADQRVILITEILGTAGFRGASGDFSLPVEGMLYENGKPSSPLKDFLISGNILQLFGNIEAVGQDALPPTGNVISPSLLVRGLNVAGQQG